MFDRVVFAEVVSIILTAGAPIYKELALGDPISDPIEAHVNCFGSSLFYGVEGEADSYFVVGLDRGWRLGMAHFVKGSANGAGISGVVVEGC